MVLDELLLRPRLSLNQKEIIMVVRFKHYSFASVNHSVGPGIFRNVSNYVNKSM